MGKEWPLLLGADMSGTFRRRSGGSSLAVAVSTVAVGGSGASSSSLDSSAWSLSADDADDIVPEHRTATTMHGTKKKHKSPRRSRQFHSPRRSPKRRSPAKKRAASSHSQRKGGAKDRATVGLRQLAAANNVKCKVGFEIRNAEGGVVTRGRRLSVTVSIREGGGVEASGGIHGGVSVSGESCLQVAVCDDSSPSAVYCAVISESLFEEMKREQKLLVDFRGFAKCLVALLAECGADFDDESTRKRALAYPSSDDATVAFATHHIDDRRIVEDDDGDDSDLKEAFVSETAAGGGRAKHSLAVGQKADDLSTSDSHASGSPMTQSMSSEPPVADFIAVLTLLETGSGERKRAVVSIEERNDFRHLQHVCLRVDALCGHSLETYLSHAVCTLRADLQQAMGCLQRVSQLHRSEHIGSLQLARRLQHTKLSFDEQMSASKMEMQSETSRLSAEFCAQKESLLAQSSKEKTESISVLSLRIESQLAEKQSLMDELQATKTRATRGDERCEAMARELTELRSEVATLREKQSRQLEVAKARDERVTTLDRQLNAGLMRVASLQQQLADSEKMCGAHSETAHEQKSALDSARRSLHSERRKNHECVKEINKGNNIISKLQAQMRSLFSDKKLLLKEVSTLKQAVARGEEDLDSRSKLGAQSNATIDTLRKELHSLQKSLATAKSKLMEAHKAIESNTRVIAYLNKTLTEREKHLVSSRHSLIGPTARGGSTSYLPYFSSTTASSAVTGARTVVAAASSMTPTSISAMLGSSTGSSGVSAMRVGSGVPAAKSPALSASAAVGTVTGATTFSAPVISSSYFTGLQSDDESKHD